MDEHPTASSRPLWEYTWIPDYEHEQERVWPPPKIREAVGYVSIPHELLVDNDPSHVCGPACPPEPAAPSTGLRYALRRARRRLARAGGLRLVHRDRVDQDRQD